MVHGFNINIMLDVIVSEGKGAVKYSRWDVVSLCSRLYV